MKKKDLVLAMTSILAFSMLTTSAHAGNVDAQTLDGLDSTDFALATHAHTTNDVIGLDSALNSKAEQSTVDAALATKADQVDLDTTNAVLATKADMNHGHFYANITVVAKSGGEYISPFDAVADLAEWCGTPSASNPCLVKVMPGVYDIGSSNLDMPSFVDLEGSGETVTKIVGISSGYSVGVVDLASAEIRNITVEEVGTNNGTAISVNRASSTLTNVTALSTGANAGSAIYISGNPGDNHNVLLRNTKIEVSGDCTRGLRISGSINVKLHDSDVYSSCATSGTATGMYLGGSPGGNRPYVEVIDSQVTGEWKSVRVWYGDIRVANSKLGGPFPVDFYAIEGSIKCFNNYDDNFDPIVCP